MQGRAKQDRNARHSSRPDRFTGFVSFNRQHRSAPQPAQFTDVSTSGMQLISRLPMDLAVGELINLEFTLPGTRERIVSQGRVVRKTSEFIFAVRFFLLDQEQKTKLQSAVSKYSSYIRTLSTLSLYLAAKSWLFEHRLGLFASTVGLAVAAACVGYIYIHSDEHRGNTLRAWGSVYPKEWSLNYYGYGSSHDKTDPR